MSMICLGVLGVEADRPGIDVGEPLEQRGLALHDGHGGSRADVAEPEHGRTVGDHRDRVALDRQPAGVLGILGDRQADLRHPGRVGPGQIVPSAQGHLRCRPRILPPRCIRKVRSLTLRTSNPGNRPNATVIAFACSSSVRVAGDVDNLSRSWCDSTTSRAVRAPLRRPRWRQSAAQWACAPRDSPRAP